MIDDEDGKVRRNLVVFSTMILVVTFLQVQPVKLIQEALKLQDLGIPPWKTWVLVSLTLAYLFYRFDTSTSWDSTHSPRPTWGKVFSRTHKPLVDELLCREARRAFKPVKPWHSTSFKPRSIASELSSTNPQFIRISGTPRVTVNGNGANTIRGRIWSGLVSLNLDLLNIENEDGKESIGSLQVNNLIFNIDRIGIFQVTWRKLLRSVFTTDEGLQHNLPRLLAMLAAACIAWQFGCIAWVWWLSGTV